MDNKEEIQNLAMEAEWQQQQARGFQEQLQNLQGIETELERTTEALKNIKEKKTTLFSLSSGVFISAELKSINRLLVNVGAGVLAEKDVDGAMQFLSDRKKEIASAREDLLKGMRMVTNRLREIDMRARTLMEQERR